MKKPFCDFCGKEIDPCVQIITVTQMNVAFSVKGNSRATSARMFTSDYCDSECLGKGVEKWMKGEADFHVKNQD